MLPLICLRIPIQRVYRLETNEIKSNMNRIRAIHIQYFRTFEVPIVRNRDAHNLLLAFGSHRAKIWNEIIVKLARLQQR